MELDRSFEQKSYQSPLIGAGGRGGATGREGRILLGETG